MLAFSTEGLLKKNLIASCWDENLQFLIIDISDFFYIFVANFIVQCTSSYYTDLTPAETTSRFLLRSP